MCVTFVECKVFVGHEQIALEVSASTFKLMKRKISAKEKQGMYGVRFVHLNMLQLRYSVQFSEDRGRNGLTLIAKKLSKK